MYNIVMNGGNMFENYNKTSIRDVLLTGLAGLVIYYLSLGLPFLLLFFPLPFVVLGLKRGDQHSLLAMMAALLGVFWKEGLGGGALLIIYSLLVTLPSIRGLRTQEDPLTYIAISAAGLIVLSLLVGLAFGQFSSINLADNLEEGLMLEMDRQIEVFSQLDMVVNKPTLEASMYMMVKTIMGAMPAILLTVSFFACLANYYLAGAISSRFFGVPDKSPRFKDFRLPKDIVWAVVILLIASYGMDLLDLGFGRELSLNAYIVLSFFFTLQGLALVISYVGQSFPRLVSYIFIGLSLISGGQIVYAAIGAIYSVYVNIKGWLDIDEK